MRAAVCYVARLELRLFFREFFPLAREEEINDVVFDLTYYSRGALTRGDVLEMEAGERNHYASRLIKALKAEAKAMSGSGLKSPRVPSRRR